MSIRPISDGNKFWLNQTFSVEPLEYCQMETFHPRCWKKRGHLDRECQVRSYENWQVFESSSGCIGTKSRSSISWLFQGCPGESGPEVHRENPVWHKYHWRGTGFGQFLLRRSEDVLGSQLQMHSRWDTSKCSDLWSNKTFRQLFPLSDEPPLDFSYFPKSIYVRLRIVNRRFNIWNHFWEIIL